MPLPDTQYDSGVAYSFMVKIDGVQIPSVVSVGDITNEVDKIEYKQQTADGKYVVRQLPGRPKPGEFTITRGMTDSKTASTWLKSVGEGDLKGARKTAEVAVLDYTGSPIRRYSFTNVWVKSVKCGGLEAGGTNPLTEEISVCYDEMTAE
jgi:phage tail-like protein